MKNLKVKENKYKCEGDNKEITHWLIMAKLYWNNKYLTVRLSGDMPCIGIQRYMLCLPRHSMLYVMPRHLKLNAMSAYAFHIICHAMPVDIPCYTVCHNMPRHPYYTVYVFTTSMIIFAKSNLLCRTNDVNYAKLK